MDTIDTELSATALSFEQLAAAKIYIFVTTKRKIIGAVVAARIEYAYPVVAASEGSSTADLIDFGNDSTALFCSYVYHQQLTGSALTWGLSLGPNALRSFWEFTERGPAQHIDVGALLACCWTKSLPASFTLDRSCRMSAQLRLLSVSRRAMVQPWQRAGWVSHWRSRAGRFMATDATGDTAGGVPLIHL